MKILGIFLAAAAFLQPGVSAAYSKTVICDGCSESGYAKLALSTAQEAGSVLVVDGRNAQLRKYRISSFGDRDREMDLFRKTAKRVEPTAEEWALFEDALAVYDAISHHLESCGPGGAGDWLVPDFTFGPACDRHDECYARGGTDDDREACDQQLYLDMRALGANHAMAAAYFLAVRAAGWMYFSYHGGDAFSSFAPNSGCAYFEVCDYTSELIMPR